MIFARNFVRQHCRDNATKFSNHTLLVIVLCLQYIRCDYMYSIKTRCRIVAQLKKLSPSLDLEKECLILTTLNILDCCHYSSLYYPTHTVLYSRHFNKACSVHKVQSMLVHVLVLCSISICVGGEL